MSVSFCRKAITKKKVGNIVCPRRTSSSHSRSYTLSAVRMRISSSKIIRRLRRLTASSSLGGTGGIHGMLVGASVALITRSITAARTAYIHHMSSLHIRCDCDRHLFVVVVVVVVLYPCSLNHCCHCRCCHLFSYCRSSSLTVGHLYCIIEKVGRTHPPARRLDHPQRCQPARTAQRAPSPRHR